MSSWNVSESWANHPQVMEHPSSTQVPFPATWLASLKTTHHICRLKLCGIQNCSWHLLSLLNKGVHFHHTPRIPPPCRYLKAIIKSLLNIFKDGSRLSLSRLLPQSLVSRANLILVTVLPKRVLLTLYMKIIPPFFCCLIFLCLYLQRLYLLLYLQRHIDFVFSELQTIVPQSSTQPLFGRRHLPVVYIWCAFLLAGHMTLHLTSLFEQALLIKQPESRSTTDSLPSLIAILPALGSLALFTGRDYIFSSTSLIKILNSTE